jgi:hypothetical protein
MDYLAKEPRPTENGVGVKRLKEIHVGLLANSS